MSTAVSPDRARELAGRLVAAWRTGRPLAPAEATRLAPASADEAYVVQDLVGAAMNWFPRGRAAAWKIASIPPTAAGVPDSFIAEAPLTLRRGDFHTLIGIEVELVVRLARDLPAGAGGDEVAAAIGATLAAIEIFDVRADNWKELPANFLLADQQMHGRLILGTGVQGPWREGFARREVVLSVNGVEKLRRRGGHALGTPVAILPWLAGHAATRGDGLRAGDLVATGSWTGLYEAQPSERIEAAFEGIGKVAVDIAQD